MTISDVPFTSFTWDQQAEVTTNGASGEARSRTALLGDYRARLVSFGPSYRADHWCAKGHVVFVLEGELELSFSDGRELSMKAGSGFVISDDDGSHMVATTMGATAIILD